MRNEIPIAETSRQPRWIVKVSASVDAQSIIMPGGINFEVDNNTFYAADTFECPLLKNAE